jgi:signal transduction histidine kinase
VLLGYWYYKDRSQYKLMFAIGAGFGTVANWFLLVSRLAMMPFIESAKWLTLPMALVVPIAAISNARRLPTSYKQVKILLSASVPPMLLFLFQVYSNAIFAGLMSIFMVISIPLLFYTVLRDKETSDAIFLIATLCFIAQGITTDAGLSMNIPILLNLFGGIMTGLMFIIPSHKQGGLASLLKLEKQLKGTQAELKIAQEKLLKAERFAAIGELAGMIGHDLRNPLQGISGAAYYLKNRTVPKDDVKGREMLAIIERCVDYSNKIISDLLDFSREATLELSGTTPKQLLQDSLIQLSVPNSIKIIDNTSEHPLFKVDRDRIKRVFINMIKNALDAMPEGGTLTITNKNSVENVTIEFKDTGLGMSSDVMNKIWTPLFTTKAKGMGFGLPICKRIVEAHGGRILVSSEINKGTIFRITLPANLETKKDEKGQTIYVNLEPNETPLTKVS